MNHLTRHDADHSNQYRLDLSTWLAAVLLDPPAPAARLARLLAAGGGAK